VDKIPARVQFALDHGADPGVGGYGARDGPLRNGIEEAMDIMADAPRPALLKALREAAQKNSKGG
jgi:hypothetical protein